MTEHKRLTLKSWRPIGAGPTLEQKNLTCMVYDILNNPNVVSKARVLNWLAETRKCQTCAETLQIRQIAWLQAQTEIAHGEQLKKALADLKARNDRLEKELTEMGLVKVTEQTVQKWFREFRADTSIYKSAEDGFHYLRGYISDSSVDRDGDRMTRSALENMKDAINSGQVNLYSDHNHGWKDTLGHFTRAEIDSKGLWGEVRLEDPARNPDVLSLLHKHEVGETIGLSIGGDMNGSENVKEYDEKGRPRTVRNIKGVRLYEVSVVGLPANAKATVTDIYQR